MSLRFAAGQRRAQGDAGALAQDVVFRAWPGAVDRARPLWAASGRAYVRGVDHRAGPVQLPGGVQFGQQQLVQPLPHPGGVPLLQASPAGHPGPEPQLLGQELPPDSGVQHEQDPTQHLPVRDPPTSRMPRVTRGRRRQ